MRGEGAPLATGSCDIQDRVDNGAQVGFSRTAQTLDRRHVRFDQPPLRIDKVACVTSPSSLSAVVLQNWRHPLARPAKRKHRLGFIASQSEIKDVKVVPHVSAVCCASDRQHPELDRETKYYLRNRLVVVTGDLGDAWFQENLAISGK
jgi:hypothetical protein